MTTRTTYRHFVCPDCYRMTTKPWGEAWCANDPTYALQAYDPTEDSNFTWTRMVELDSQEIERVLEAHGFARTRNYDPEATEEHLENNPHWPYG